ncbi:MAG: winged helix-turn-helix domain-containing protein [Candidatus ainarchaeum sp.]|nr:winged helix-turn-helix domain-containing protein [Candidatus ainarchaeum sp.]
MKTNSSELHPPYKCLEVLGNEVRIGIIQLLMKKELTVLEICKKLNKEQSLISHSLKQLRECSFVDFKKEGKKNVYYLKSEIFQDKNKTLIEMFMEHSNKYCKGKK